MPVGAIMTMAQARPGPEFVAESESPRRWRRVIAIAAGIVVLAALVGVGTVIGPPLWRSIMAPRTARLAFPGVVEAQEIRLGSKVGGRVSEVHVREGDRIAPGAPLITLEVPELEAQRAQWQAKGKADLAALEKARNGARREEIAAAAAAVAAASARNDRIKKGFREEEIREARNDWLSAEADLKLAEENLGRYDALLRKNSTTKSQVDAAQADLDRSRGRASAARAHFDLVTRGNRPEEIAEAAALLDQARANLDLLKAGTRAEDIAAMEAQVEQTRARLREVDANLAEAVVRSPGRALIDVISVRKGDLVAPGQAVVRILSADDLWVKVFIPETELGRVVVGQPAEVTIDSHPGVRFEGRVVQIAHESEFTPRNIQSLDERRHQVFAAKVRVTEPDGIFKSGMAAEVYLPAASAPPPARSEGNR